jgi:nucleoside-specific outer membrane channel protein Tsx
MQKKILWIGLVLFLTSSLRVNAQYAKQDSTYKRWYVGSTLYLLGNFDKVNPPASLNSI